MPLIDYSSNKAKYQLEVSTYKALGDKPWSPSLLRHGINDREAWIVTKRLPGRPLNQLYTLIGTPPDDEKETIISTVLAASFELLRYGLYWNDMSAHNIMLSKESIRIFDFGDSQQIERHNHLAMLTWLLRDVQEWHPVSYELDVYSRIFAAGQTPNSNDALCFLSDSNFFCPSLRWIYEAATSARSFAGMLAQPGFINQVIAKANRLISIE